jgi:YggT family protein
MIFYIVFNNMNSLVILISQITELFIWLLIIQAIMSWLINFGIINTQSNFVNMIGSFLYKVTEPLLRPIRKLLPEFGGVDISPVILIILLIFFRNLLFEYTGMINFS